MARSLSLAYLSAHRCTPAEALQVAAATGYAQVGLRLWPNAPGAPQQHLLGDAQALRETLAVQRDTGVGVMDVEIVRLGEDFDAHRWDALFELAATLGATQVLVAGDDPLPARLAANFAEVCAVMQPYGLTANLEFMPWTEVRDARAAVRVLEKAGRPRNAGVLIDALHFGRSRTTLDDLRAIPREWLHYAQICDAPAGLDFSTEAMIRTARSERDLPGEGSIDLQGLMGVLPADLPISVEIIDVRREDRHTPEQWAARCLQSSRIYTG